MDIDKQIVDLYVSGKSYLEIVSVLDLNSTGPIRPALLKNGIIPSRHKKILIETKEEIVRLAREEGLSVIELMSKFSLSKSSIRSIFVDYGVSVRHSGFSDQQDLDILSDYKLGMSLKDISKKYKCRGTYITGLARKNGIARNVFSKEITLEEREAIIQMYQNGVSLNEIYSVTKLSKHHIDKILSYNRDRNSVRYNSESYRYLKNRLVRYHLTPEEYWEIERKQEYRCAICGKIPGDKDRPLGVDHCHKSGKVRALLCQYCNAGLGFFSDDIELLCKAVKYLKDFS